MTSYLKDRRVWAWSLYDFANSAFATVMLSVVFNVYFVQRVVPPEGALVFGVRIPGESLWAYTVSASMIVTFLIAPLIGTLADQSGLKKKFLVLFWFVGSLSSAGLFWVRPGELALAIGLFMVANVCFASGNVFYNAFLPELGSSEKWGRISGFGWAVGYAGGGLSLALCLLLIRAPGVFGLSPENYLPVRVSLLSAGLWWLVFGLPLLFWLPDPAPAGVSAPSIGRAFRGLVETFRHVRDYRNLFTFIAAFLIYNDGIETIIVMASIFGAKALGMKPDDLVLCFLMIQAVAFVGALIFGWLADRLRHKKTIYITLAVYAVSLLWASRMETQGEYWILGAVIGLVLGGSQAASRSLMALLTPASRSAEFFAFYGVAGKLTSMLGPLLFGAVSQLYGIRAGVLSLLIFFLGGGIVLYFVKEEERPAPSAAGKGF
jgi:MFS transporter, UMF1 family